MRRENNFFFIGLLKRTEKNFFDTSSYKKAPLRKEFSSRRSFFMMYHLKLDDQILKVCKIMFLNTFDIWQAFISITTKDNFSENRNNNRKLINISIFNCVVRTATV